jgi:hypothetical protein
MQSKVEKNKLGSIKMKNSLSKDTIKIIKDWKKIFAVIYLIKNLKPALKEPLKQ